MKALNTRCLALQKLSKVCNFKTRKIVANGIFLSKLIYLISVWSSCSKELFNALQVLQNRAARAVTRNSWENGTKETLKQIGWLSVFQLAQYHSIVLIYQLRKYESPKYLHEMYDWSLRYPTRQATDGWLKVKGIPKMELTKNGFRNRASKWFNKLPGEISNIEDTKVFKKELKQWIQDNVQIRA